MTPFRQPIYPGDVGADVFAVRRALRNRGFHLPPLGKTAGPRFVAAIRKLQGNHRLKADGIYGPATHRIVTESFDKWGAWLYAHAAIRSHYINPFHRSTGIRAGRIDQGVDYHGYGPISAIGDCRVLGLYGGGWPGGQFICYELLNGAHAGRRVYVAEAVIPKVHPGQLVKAGETICLFGSAAAPGRSPGIETGWAAPSPDITWYRYRRGPYHEQGATVDGTAFARLLHRLGAPLPYVPGHGEEFIS